MCSHVFIYPEDIRQNYNQDKETLTGKCRYCGLKRKSYGRRWAIDVEDNFLHKEPYGESLFKFDIKV